VIPKQGIFEGDIGIANGKISALTAPGGNLPSASDIDAQGLHVFPGVIGPHSHIGLGAGTKDLDTETKAAAQGGVCTNIFFLRLPEPYDKLYHEMKEAGESLAYGDFTFHLVLLVK
jgi:dihydroorotase-like cyclic amidohydrolase